MNIELNMLCKKMLLSKIYLCHKTRLFEALIPTEEYNRIFKEETQDSVTLNIKGEEKNIKLKKLKSRTCSGDFIYGSTGTSFSHDGGIEYYDVEIAGNIESLVDNINIALPEIVKFLDELKSDNRSPEVLEFAKSKKYMILPRVVNLESDVLLNIEKAFFEKERFVYRLKKDLTIEKVRIYFDNIKIHHKKEGKIDITFGLKTYTDDVIEFRCAIFEVINDRQYFSDSSQEWFSDPNYLKTVKVREQRKALKAFESSIDAIDLENESKVFEL